MDMGIVTLISERTIEPELVHKVLDLVPDVKDQRSLSPRALEINFEQNIASIGGQEEWVQLRNRLYDATANSGVDVILQGTRLEPGLVVFDMDSTLIQQEVIDVIASYAGLEDEVSTITEAAMRGEIDFNESLAQRVALLKGIQSTVFESLKEKITLTPGVRGLTKALKNLNVKMAVLSGGFVPLASWVKSELGLDYMYANNLEVAEDKLTGKTYGRIINGQAKAEILSEIALKENVPLSNVIAVGDGSNDLPMMATAGFGIAFNAKPIVQQKAPSRINTRSLQDILYILGYNDSEQEKLIK